MRFDLLNGKLVEMVQYQITPDRTTHNRKVHDLFRGFSSFYVNPLDQLRGKTGGAFWWDVMLEPESIKYFATFPAEWQKEVLSMLKNTWEGASIERGDGLNGTKIPWTADVVQMKYRRSDMFSLKVDNRMEHEPMDSILSIVADLEAGDVARYSICAEPTSRLDWQDRAEKLQEQFKRGTTPKRRRWSQRDAAIGVGEFIARVLQSALDGIYTVLDSGDDKTKQPKQDDYEKRLLTLDGLSPGTVKKPRLPVFNTHIRMAAYSEDTNKQRIIVRSMANSFNDLTAENELERHEYPDKLKPTIMKELNSFRISLPTRLDFDKNKMSNEELGRLVETPTAYLQDKYKDALDALDSRQIDVPALLLKGGIPLGTVSFKKTMKEVFFPVNNHDQLCLPSCVIGGMGSGKTKGFAANRAIDFVKAGFSSIVFDPKKSEVWEQVAAGLPEHQRQRILLGEFLLSLDFREALHSKAARNRLAQILLKFFEDNADAAGAQTQRFLQAAVFAMKTGRLKEIIQIFQDKAYRQRVIKEMPEGMHRLTLEQFDNESAARQNQILSPIWNRLNVILGDEYLSACMDAVDGLDMVQVLSKRGMCTVFDLPDRLNTREAKDVLVNLLSFKIDIAMSLREDLFPVAIIYDEPHQYLRSADLWKKVAVESRAYRLSYHWLFHSWEQIPRDLAQIIKDAGPHFYIYNSSKTTYKGLAEELAPFTIQEGLSTKVHHAICALKVGENRMTPLTVKMKAPVIV